MKKGTDIQERTIEFACQIMQLHDTLMKHRGAARTVAGQLLKAGTAVGALLEEADAAESKPDFICKCSIALKEARESYYWLRLLRKYNSGLTDKFKNLVQEANEIVAILTTIVKNARKLSPSR